MRRRDLSLFLSGCCLAACGEDSDALSEGTVETAVFRWIDFAREERGVTVGFDLDGLVTTRRDAQGCRQDDFRSAIGESGIDNNLSIILPLIDLAAENAVQALLMDALNEGRLLIFVDRIETSRGWEVRLRRGEDTPLRGNDGFLLAGQTLALHPEDSALGRTNEVKVNGSVWEASGFDLRLPAVVFTTLYVLDLLDARVRFELSDTGELLHGWMSGGLTVEQLLEIIRVADSMINPDSSVEALVGDLLWDIADLAPRQGQCQQISATIQFEAVPAFVFE